MWACICVSTVYVGACVFIYVWYISVGVALYSERPEDGLGWLEVSSSFTWSCCFEAGSPPELEAYSLFLFFPRSGLKIGKAQWLSCPYLPQRWFTRLYGTTPGWLLLGLTLQRAVHMSRNSSLGSAHTGLWDCWWILETFLRNLGNGFLSVWKSHFPVLFLSLVDEASCSLLTHTEANAHVQTPQICIHLYLLHVFQPLLASWSFLSPPPINYVF